MPKFFFDVYDGHSKHDEEGTELPDVEAARQEAIRFAGALLQEEAHRVGLGHWRMEVMNEQGEICFGLSFDVFETAAASTGHSASPSPPPGEI